MGSIDVAKVITAAAQSSLGVLSLIILAVSFVGYNFFKRSGDGVKIGVFAVMLLAGLGFGVSVAREGREAVAEPEPHASPSGTPSASRTGEPSTAPKSASDLAGRWHDDDGYVYDVRVAGTALSYDVFRAGVRMGQGQGTIAGDRLDYAYTDAQFGDGGKCTASVARDRKRIAGTCTEGGQRWGFAIVR